MIKVKLKFLAFLGAILCLISCNNSKNNTTINNKPEGTVNKSSIENAVSDSKIADDLTANSKARTKSSAANFVKCLKNGEKLSSFFIEPWILIYHEDNRCNGSTDGQVNNLKSTQIDSIIPIDVKNDSDGWACDKKTPKNYVLDFDLKKLVKHWDRFEIPNYENEDDYIVYLVGAGESDYLKLHYNTKNLITKLEYRSEDPG